MFIVRIPFIVPNRLAQMRLGVQRAIGVTLQADMRHRALEVAAVEPMARAIGVRKLGEGAGRRAIGHTKNVRKALAAERQDDIARVLELLDASAPSDINWAGGAVNARGAH